jgi:Kef-type K+ transport system membrane component KefB
VGKQLILFVLAVAFGIVEASRALGLESEFYILASMAAGFVVQNFSAHGPKFVKALEANSLPIYALFFSVAGADLDLGEIPAVWQIGLLIFATRVVLIYSSTYLGARIVGDSASIRQYAWMGFLAQAGVTLGLATIVRDRFPAWGTEVAAIIVALIAINQLVGPPLFRFALVRGGEAGSDSRTQSV